MACSVLLLPLAHHLPTVQPAGMFSSDEIHLHTQDTRVSHYSSCHMTVASSSLECLHLKHFYTNTVLNHDNYNTFTLKCKS